jgi:intein/homing endonuclease
MILVSIYSNEENFVIRLNHKIDYVVEKKFKKTRSLNNRTSYLVKQLFLLFTKLIFKEIFVRYK